MLSNFVLRYPGVRRPGKVGGGTYRTIRRQTDSRSVTLRTAQLAAKFTPPPKKDEKLALDMHYVFSLNVILF